MIYLVIRKPRIHLRRLYRTIVAPVEAESTRKAIDAAPADLREADRDHYQNPEAHRATGRPLYL